MEHTFHDDPESYDLAKQNAADREPGWLQTEFREAADRHRLREEIHDLKPHEVLQAIELIRELKRN